MASPYTALWTPDPGQERRFRSAVTAVTFALTHPDLTEVHRTRLLNDTLWYLLEGDRKGDWKPVRYRSRRMLDGEPGKFQRDHVVTRRRLIAELQAEPGQVESILRKNVACLVTKDEHTRIGRFDKIHDGWYRYLAAGVDVVDMATGTLVIEGGQYVNGGPPHRAGRVP